MPEAAASPPTLAAALADKRILVCVGSGGVGKTTTAATLALEAARRGRRTLVLTIDPAKRLANSLGLAGLGHELQEVDPALVHRGQPAGSPGSLHAMMLDQKRAFDEMVARYARDPEAVKRIFENPVYAQVSASLAGAQEYAALTKLHEFDTTGAWDLIVVDTPPTAHALDFLDAPQKLTAAIDSPAIDWFRKMQGGGGSRWSIVGKTGAFVLRRLAKFVGSRFLDDLAVFFTEFNDILGGFRQRAEETFGLLRQPRVGFILVASPEPMATQEALYFHQRLVAADMPLVGFVVNKVHASRPSTSSQAELEATLAATPAIAALGLSATSLRIAAEAMRASHAELQIRAEADARTVDRLRQAAGPGAVLVTVPMRDEDVHDVERLHELGEILAGPRRE